MSDKVLLKSFEMNFEADVAVSALHNAGIPNWILNKKDSSYLTFGSIELYVDRDRAKEALELITAEGE